MEPNVTLCNLNKRDYGSTRRFMKKSNLIAGLEIARNRIGMVVGETVNGNFNFLNAFRVNLYDGIKNGSVINLDIVAEAITRLTEEVNQKTGRKISSVFVNISGPGLTQEIANAVITLPQRGCEVTQKNIKDLIGSCKIVSIPLDRYLLYLSPLEYIIDGQDGVKNPLGLCGSKLEAKIYLITAAFNQVQNIQRAVNFAGLEIEDYVLNPIANSYSLLNESDRTRGVLLADFKTDLTELAVIKGESLLFFKTIPIGQSDVTREISKTLGVSFDYAEEIKMKYAFLKRSGKEDKRDQETIPLEWMGKSQTVSRGDLNGIISNKLTEIAEQLLKETRSCEGLENNVKSGVVIKGGCTHMEGFVEWAAERVGFMTRQSPAASQREAGESEFSPWSENYCVSSGLVKYGLKKGRETTTKTRRIFLKRVVEKTGQLLSDYF